MPVSSENLKYLQNKYSISTSTNKKPTNAAKQVADKYADTTKQTNENISTEKPKQDFLKSLAVGLVNPFARMATGAQNIAAATLDVTKMGVKRLQGEDITEEDWQKLDDDINRRRTFLGQEFKAVGADAGNITEFAKDVIGTGAELGSFIGGGAGVKSVAKIGIKGSNLLRGGLKGSAYWATSGALGAGGYEAQKAGSTAGDIAAASLLGAGVGAGFGLAGGGIESAIVSKIKKPNLIKQAIMSNAPGSAQYTILKSGKVIEDKVAKQAISSGIPEKIIKVIKDTSDDLTAYQKMFKTARHLSNNPLSPANPKDIAGETLINRVKYIKGQKSLVGQIVESEIKKMPNVNLNITPIYNDFREDLSNKGIKIIKGQLNFEDSVYRDTPTVQNLIVSVYKDLRPGVGGYVWRTPEKINKIRQRIFENLDMASKKEELLTESGEAAIKNVREALKEPLNKLSPINKKTGLTLYQEATRKYSKIMDTLREFKKTMGRDWSLDNDLIVTKAGEILNRVQSNASSGIKKFINDIDETVQMLGMKTKQNLTAQVYFNRFIEDLFDIAGEQTLQKQVQKGTERAVSGAADVAAAAAGGIGSKINLINKSLNKVTGATLEKQKEALRILLKITE